MIGRQAGERDVDDARMRVERAEHGATTRAAERTRPDIGRAVARDVAFACRDAHALFRHGGPRHECGTMRTLTDRAVAMRDVIQRAGDLEADGAAEARASRIALVHVQDRRRKRGMSPGPEQALAFHRTADRIAVAAREHDRARVLEELGATLESCTSCHATWKQQVVDEATWEGLTSTGSMDHAMAR